MKLPKNLMSSIYYNATNLVITEVLPVTKDQVINHFGVERVFIRPSMAVFNSVISYVKRFYKNAEKWKDDDFKNKRIFVCIDNKTFLLFTAGKKLYLTKSKLDMGKTLYNDISESDFKLYIFGKKSVKYNKELDEILKRDSSELRVYNVSGSKNEKSEDLRCTVQDMHKRGMDTLFFDNDVKGKITNHIDSFFENHTIYDNRNLRYKTGILLYGEPGTGKTSLSNAIATYCKRNLIVVDMTMFSSLDTASLTASIDSDDQKYVVLLEDIDCIFETLNREDDETADKDDKKVINKLLQFLDGNNSPNDVIFVATTNYLERLDAAIIRDGRFDLKVPVPAITIKEARNMCKSFDLTENQIDKIIASYDDENHINQSNLQNKILGEFKAL